MDGVRLCSKSCWYNSSGIDLVDVKAVREGNARIVTERAKQFLQIVRDERVPLPRIEENHIITNKAARLKIAILK